MKLQDILSKLESKGAKTYYVGGFVRDKILGKDSKDIDIEIFNLTEDEFVHLLTKEFKLSVDLVGKSFGIYKVVTDKGDIDFSFPRTEKLTGEKHTDFEVVVDPFISPYKASLRRDFTFSALMEDTQTGELLDFHKGIEDLKQGIVRHTSDKFSEDPLRVFRAAQFASRFDFSIAKETIELAKTIKVDSLSKERIFEEFSKAITKSKTPSTFFFKLKEMGKLPEFFSPLDSLEETAFCKKMKMIDELISKVDVVDKTTLAMVLTIIEVDSLTTDKYIKNFILAHSLDKILKAETTKDILLLAHKSSSSLFMLAEIVLDVDLTELKFFFDKQIKEVLTGKDLVDLGFKPSKEFSSLIQKSVEMAFSGMDKETIKKHILA